MCLFFPNLAQSLSHIYHQCHLRQDNTCSQVKNKLRCDSTKKNRYCHANPEIRWLCFSDWIEIDFLSLVCSPRTQTTSWWHPPSAPVTTRIWRSVSPEQVGPGPAAPPLVVQSPRGLVRHKRGFMWINQRFYQISMLQCKFRCDWAHVMLCMNTCTYICVRLQDLMYLWFCLCNII